MLWFRYELYVYNHNVCYICLLIVNLCLCCNKLKANCPQICFGYILSFRLSGENSVQLHKYYSFSARSSPSTQSRNIWFHSTGILSQQTSYKLSTSKLHRSSVVFKKSSLISSNLEFPIELKSAFLLPKSPQNFSIL